MQNNKQAVYVRLYGFEGATELAIKFNGEWYPKKLLWNFKEHSKHFSCNMPKWLAVEKGVEYKEIIHIPEVLDVNNAKATNELQD